MVLNDPLILKSVKNMNTLPVIDMEDKITAEEKELTLENITNSIILSMDNRIGEYSNVASGYHNKCAKTPEQKQKYLDFIDLVSILNAKEIDFAKTGVRFNLPPFIGKYAKPLPYFMKYASEYYSMQKLSKSKSNLNRLSFDIEKWHKNIRYKRTYNDFDYKIMIDDSILFDDEKFTKLEEIYLDYKAVVGKLKKDESIARNFFHPDHENMYGDLTWWQIKNTSPNFKKYYDVYKEQCLNVCRNKKEMANYLVKLCYEKYPRADKNFAWIMANDGIVDNINQVTHLLPERDLNGEYEYLGKKYKLTEYIGEIK